MKQNYVYPEWIDSIQKIKQVNRSEIGQLWVSLLKTVKGTTLDLRIWYNGHPTSKGLFISHDTALILIDLLDRFLAGEDLV